MWEYVPPLGSVSEANSPPESEVTVCGAVSWFSHVTVDPASTVIAVGLNENDWMSTVFGVDGNVVTVACADEGITLHFPLTHPQEPFPQSIGPSQFWVHIMLHTRS